MLKCYRSLAAVLGAAAIALAGCSSQAPFNPPRKLADSFDDLLSQYLSYPPSNEFERETFLRAKETGRISQGDYDEAYARFADCASEAGEPVRLKKLRNGLYREETTPLDPGESLEAAAATISTCQKSTIGFIPELFKIQQENPTLLGDHYEVAYRCLERSGLMPDGYSLKEFTDIQRKGPKPGGGSYLSDMPFDFMSDDVQACMLAANISIFIE